MPLKVIGLTGTISSGKAEATKIIVAETGAMAFSLSDSIRDEISSRGLEITRALLREVGQEIREKEGSGAWALRLIPLVEELDGVVVVESIRNPGEVDAFREALGKNFFLIAVDAPPELRFKRAFDRSREGEKKTFEEFKEVDEREQGKQEPESGHNIRACIDAADEIIENVGTLEEFKAKLLVVLSKLKLSK